MNLILHLNAETEARLKFRADQTGRSLEELAIEALHEKLASDVEVGESQAPGSRIAAFHAWLESHPASASDRLDDSRESIYAGRRT